MEIILNFLVENYLWFLIISLILIFGLIGYIVDAHEKRTPKLHFQDNEEDNELYENQEVKSLKELLEENDKEEAVEELQTCGLNDAINLNVAVDNNLDNNEELPKNE